ncbi:MAG: xanthine dehydrogenase family protein molybdopterin-binding subunit [Rhizobiaceae bacterium]|nr:xanthine dehydrogenase family protein molybdopterin-binding subunit [Rhizobiaceae bacterium]
MANKVAPPKFGMGKALRRIEDDALITGRGRFTDDHSAEGMLHAYVVRSPVAHGTFTIRGVSEALKSKGVHLVLTGEDVASMQPMPCKVLFEQPDGTPIPAHGVPVLCMDTVRHVGDGVAFIVADSVDEAKDGAELLEIDYEMLDAEVDMNGALKEDASLVYPDSGSNLAYRNFVGDREKTEAAFDNASHISEIKIINNRLICNYLEPRSCLAEWDADKERFEVIVCSQGVHSVQSDLCTVMGLEKEQVHVMTRDVGGGFGTKVFSYREYPLAMEAAKRLGRPVKWTSDRTEHFLADAHGRDNITTAKMAMDKDGRFLAIKVDLMANMGAYLHCFGPFIPNLAAMMTTGVYDIAAMAMDIRGVFTNTVSTDAYRGAGRPEAAYLIERLVEKCALDMGLSSAEIRHRNFIKPEQMPYTTASGRKYDTGEYAQHMKLCMERARWDNFDERNEEAKSRGKFRGIGMATYVEACAFAGSEPAFVELKDDGSVDLKIGTQSNGQGHATAYAQLAAEKLGLDYTKINLRQGDTDELEKGGGTGGSRSVPLGGVSATRAAQSLADKIRDIAADKLEASAGDIELKNGEARIVGTDRAVTFAELAQSASDREQLQAEGNFEQAEATYPNGTHICEVEIDPATASTRVIAYTIVDDFGVTVNPLLLAGQIHGGVVQGIGQCLHERTVHDEDGQLLSASLMDYCVPRADDIPNFSFETRNVPSTTNALGIKGAGEAGTIGACPAVMNSVANALRREYGIEHVDMPVTPGILWGIIKR